MSAFTPENEHDYTQGKMYMTGVLMQKVFPEQCKIYSVIFCHRLITSADSESHWWIGQRKSRKGNRYRVIYLIQ